MRYPPDYIEKVFLTWYENGRLSAARLQVIIDDWHGNKPHAFTLQKWINENDWHARADFQDSEIRRELERQLIEEKVVMFVRHAKLAREVQEKGWDFLKEHGVRNANEALRAIELGIKVEKESSGVPDAIKAIADKSDQQLKNTIKKLLAGLEKEQITGTIDAEFKEIPDE